MRIVIIMMMMTLLSVLQASSSIEIKKGWQLIGVPTSLDVAKTFNTKDVEVVWGYDALNQEWKGYSPDENKSTIIENRYVTLDKTKAYQALWVLSKEAWVLKYTEQESLTSAKNRTLKLETGWNLITIPQEIVVSKEFFADALVWRYSDDKGWSVNDANLNFPTIEAIKESEGLWVKSDEARSINIDEAGAALHTFDSRESMLEYIRKMIEMNQYYYGYNDFSGGIYDVVALDDSDFSGTPIPLSENDAGSVDSTTAIKAEDATSTNLQEEGVDEGDILKHDDQYIYSVDNSNHQVIVTSFENISKGIYTPITTLDFSDKTIVSMYLQNSRLVVVSNNAYNYYFIDDVTSVSESVKTGKNRLLPYNNTATYNVEIFDISDVQNITRLAIHTIDGTYNDSRLIGDSLYMISKFTPRVEYEYPKIYVDTPCNNIDRDKIYANCSYTSSVAYPEEDSKETASMPLPPKEICEYSDDYLAYNENRCYMYQYDKQGAWKYDYTNPIIASETLVPSIVTDTDASKELVKFDRFYAPSKLNQSASITTLTRFSIESGAYQLSSSFLGNTHTYYASLTSLYLISDEYPIYYDYMHYKEQQMIYTFGLDDNLSYRAKGTVEGRMLNQFSMSEKDDYLRVATTSGWSWWRGGDMTNSVYTLKLEDKKLAVEGTLSGLGHEGETIRSVRFMGDRGFVVTFKQTDPLYTLDMSNPKEPKAVGELSIPGYSSYLHVIDENRVLSVGRNADADGRVEALQLQLFDISDFAKPLLADKVLIGTRSTYSEAEHNHKAFSYRASDLMFGIPYRTYSSTDNTHSENFGVYQVNGLKIEPVHTVKSSSSEWGNVGRGLIFDLNNTSYGSLLKGSHIICDKIK